MPNSIISFFESDQSKLLFTAIVIFGGIILNFFLRSNAKGISVILRGAKKKHNWIENTEPLQTSRCSICEMLLVTLESFYCDTCGVTADIQCLKKANNTVRCKKMFTEAEGPLKHVFVKGNLPIGSECKICHEECSHDFKCIWCHLTVHATCKKQLHELCDTGKYKNFIIPPSSVIQKVKRTSVGRLTLFHEIKEPEWSTNKWTPLFVLVSRKSGGHHGGNIISAFRNYLNPLQIIELGEQDPTLLCQWLDLLPDSASPRIIIGAGDGGIAWVLSILHQGNCKKKPPVAVIPLGTGNDLARVLRWGSKPTIPFSVTDYIDSLQKSRLDKLDRWEVNYQTIKRRTLTLNRSKKYYMYNYMSIGADALVALNFHETRNARSYLFGSQLRNKLMYLVFGTKQVLDRECKGLESHIELYLDDVFVPIPELEAVIILNIQSYGGGVDLWKLTSESDLETGSEQSFSDSKLEVAGAVSLFQLAQFQLGFSKPLRLGTGSTVRVILKKHVPMQIDGEPWMQLPGQFEITIVNQADVLLGSC